MLYHASPIGGLTELRPHISNHGIPLLYFSQKRENTFVYLSNAVEKYCRETGFAYNGPWKKWGPYGFTDDGRQRLEEYYPNALEETYRGVSGYIYTVEKVIRRGHPVPIPDTVTSRGAVEATGCEFIPDAWEAILQAEQEGLLVLRRYEEMTEREADWLRRTVREEYRQAEDHPEYNTSCGISSVLTRKAYNIKQKHTLPHGGEGVPFFFFRFVQRERTGRRPPAEGGPAVVDR